MHGETSAAAWKNRCIPSGADGSMQVSEQGHHAALIPRTRLCHPTSQVLKSLRGQHIPTVQLAAPHPLQKSPI